MGKRDQHSRGVAVHMVRDLAIGGSYTACGHIYYQPQQVTTQWSKVTCGNCLSHRPLRTTRKASKVSP